MDDINTDEAQALIQESAEKLRAYLANPNLTPYMIGLLIQLSVNLELHKEMQIKIADSILNGNDKVIYITSISNNALDQANGILTSLAHFG